MIAHIASTRFLLAVLVSATVACGAPPPERPNIILISIDSLRADHLGSYGHDRDTSPNLDRFAEDAVLYETAYSTTSWTLPSHASMLTGLYPEVHGVLGGKDRLPKNAVTISETLQATGYRTAALVAAPYLQSRFGFNQGWDTYDDKTIRFRNSKASHRGATTERAHARATEILDQLGDGPFFLFLHYWDVHYDYLPPSPWDRRFDPDYDGPLTGEGFYDDDRIHAGMAGRDLDWIKALYDGEIAYTDHYLGQLFEEIRRRALYEDALIIIVADHGDEFFEHGSKGHRGTLFDETLRVPLLVRFPGGRWAGTRRAEPVSVVDLAPTMAEWSGAEHRAVFNGTSLPAGSERPRQRALFADLHGREKAVVRDGWKLVARAEKPPLLFDLENDPGEQTNLAREEPRRVAEMRHSLSQWLTLAADQHESLGKEAVVYDEETRKVLESLGYVD